MHLFEIGTLLAYTTSWSDEYNKALCAYNTS